MLAYLVELNDVGMSEDLEDADLSCNAFDIRLLDDLLLLQGLNGHFLASRNVNAKAHLAESALADGLACVSANSPILYCPSTNSPPAVLIAIINFQIRMTEILRMINTCSGAGGSWRFRPATSLLFRREW